MTVGGVLFDIDGVLVTSWEPIDGAARSEEHTSELQSRT